MKRQLLILLISSLLSLNVQAQWYQIGADVSEYVIGFDTYHDTIFAYSFGSPYLLRQVGSSWENWPAPVPNSNGIHSSIVVDDILFVVPYATTSNNYVYYWEDNAWKSLGDAFSNTANDSPNLYDILFYDNHLYVCGEFDRIGNETVHGIARWDITHWSPLGSGVSGFLPPPNLNYPHDLEIFNDELVLSGNFVYAGDSLVNGIAAWNGSSWHGFGQGFDKVVYGAGVYQGELYAGGEFTHAIGSSETFGYIAKWSNGAWQYPGFGVKRQNGLAYVHTIRTVANHLYLLGGFDTVSDSFGEYEGGAIARWNSSYIDPLYGGLNNPPEAEAIYPYQGGMLVGGDFSGAGNTSVNGIAFLYDDGTTFVEATNNTQAPKPFVVRERKIYWQLPTSGFVPTHYRIWSLNGQEMASGNTTTPVSIADLAANCYIIQLYDDHQIGASYQMILP